MGSAARDPSLSRIPGQTVKLRPVRDGYLLAQVDEHDAFPFLTAHLPATPFLSSLRNPSVALAQPR